MKIVHLCDDLMNLYGDYGNVRMLGRKLGEDTEVKAFTIGDRIDLTDADVVYIGSGTERNQKVALNYLCENSDELKSAFDRGVIFLATGNSFEIFGKSVTDKDGKEYKGLGFFDYETIESNIRTVTDAQCKLTGTEISLIGFINKASETKGIKNPLFEMISGAGNTQQETTEGVWENNFFGTHIIGPLLVRNPEFLEWFVDKVKK